MIDVCLLGTGGMMPLPDRFLTSLYVRTNGEALLIDCGEGTQTAIRKAGLRFKCIKALLITHYHADHISGLPGLLLTLGNEDRTEPLHIYGPVGLRRIVTSLRVIVPDLPYEIELHELDDNENTFKAAGLDVTSYPANHGMPCLSYVMNLRRSGKFDPAKARDAGVPLELWSRLQNGESAGGFSPDDVLGPTRKGLKLLYSTDTRPLEANVQLGADADLMILEGMFGEPEKDARAVETHHQTMQDACITAKSAGAKQLWLTHYSPANPHPEEFSDILNEIFPNTVISIDGLFTTLTFES